MFNPVKFMTGFIATIVFCSSIVLTGGTAEAVKISVVDVNKVYAESDAAKDADKHVAEVRKVLQKGLNDLEKRLAQNKAVTAEARERDLVNGHRVLERQMKIEIQAARNVVSAMMVECIKEWRRKNGGVVMAKSQLLDYSSKLDITDTVIKAMNKKKAKFADMPVVKFNESKKTKK